MPDSPQTNPATPTQDPTPSGSFINRLSKKQMLILGGVVILLAAIALFLGLSSKEKSDIADSNSAVQKEKESAFQKDLAKESDKTGSPENLRTIVYGSWQSDRSSIKILDLISNKSTLLATLPLSIKKVSVLSPQQLVYIEGTDKNDHGKQIASYKIKDKTSKTIMKADEGYGIDDYVLSPTEQYMAVWEVALAPGSNVLAGGRSRVYAIKLSEPSNVKLLYDETASAPVHYPRTILDDGKVFTDTFLPNDPAGGAGWSYGMGVSDFDGSNKKVLDNMQNGTYGTQPYSDSTGRYLVFAGYDGSKGDGKAIKDGFRQSILSPNTVEVLNTATLTRQKLSNLPNSNIYPNVNWDLATGNIIVTILAKTETESGLFSYDLSKKTVKNLHIPATEQAPYSYVSSINNNAVLIGLADQSESSLGNLGDTYAPSLTQLYNFDLSKNQATGIQLDDQLVQYMTSLPQNYFQSVLGAQTSVLGTTPVAPQPTFIDLYSNQNSNKKNLQLYTFYLKAALEQTRQEQNSQPVSPTPLPTTPPQPGRVIPTIAPHPTMAPTINCTDLARKQCGNQSWNTGQCIFKLRVDLKNQGKCNQSPLYLYGHSGQEVEVQIQTPLYNDLPHYGGGYKITILDGGQMEVNGEDYDAINYDYRSNARILRAPSQGAIVKKENAVKILTEYANKLGLNQKETDDLIKAGKAKIKSPYAFISFFNQEKSEQILPISFSPKPDNYLNVVFYFKNLSVAPDYTPVPPVFPAPLKRTGLTAVEVSEIVE